MATFLARHACRSLRHPGSTWASLPQRTIHSTATLQKKKGKAAIDDLFGDDAFSQESLVREEAKSSKAPTPETPAAQPVASKATAFKRAKLDAAERSRRFNQEIAFVEPRIGRNPEVKTPHVRKRVWLGLLDLAQTEEDLRRFVELLPKYRDGKGEYPPHLAGAFVRRCQELRCPSLALEVFGDYAKYNLNLELDTARWLVHSLHVDHSLEQLLLALSFYPVYNLPSITEDLPTAAMVAAGCFKHNTPDAIQLAQTLLPHIEIMTKGVDMSTAKDLEAAKMNKWTTWSLRKVNKAVKEETGKPLFPLETLPLKIDIQSTSAAPAPEAPPS